MESRIRANAELVREVAREKLGVEIQYDEDGVRWLDGYIDDQRDEAAQDLKDRLPSTLGSYLGECVRLTYGGEWLQDAQTGWMVKINDKLSVYPFNKVRKQLNNAEGDSVLAFFRTIPALLHGKPVVSRRPWWKFW